MQEVRDILQDVVRAVWGRLEATGFGIKDHKGSTGSTAILVSGLQKVQLLAVYKAALEQREGVDGEEYNRIDRLYKKGRLPGPSA